MTDGRRVARSSQLQAPAHSSELLLPRRYSPATAQRPPVLEAPRIAYWRMATIIASNAPPPADISLLQSRLGDRYTIERVLGRGGMADRHKGAVGSELRMMTERAQEVLKAVRPDAENKDLARY